MNRVRITVVVLAMVLMMASLAGCGANSNAVPEVNVSKKPVVIKVIHPEAQMRSGSSAYKATLEPAQEAEVSPQSSGKVLKVLFEDGKRIAPGAPLVILDDRAARSQVQVAQGQLSSAQAAQQKAETSLANTRASFLQIETLYKSGAVAQAEYDSALTTLKMQEADILSTRAAIQSAAGILLSSQIALDNMVIRAPMGGVLDGKSVAVGQQVNPDSKLGRVMDVSSVDAVFEVDQKTVSELELGAKAQVKLKKNVEEFFQGSVINVGLSADPASRVFKVKVRLQNTSGKLRPGVMAWVTVESGESVSVLTLPVEVITGKEGAYAVFVHEKGVAVKKTVLLGDIIGNRVVVISGIEADSEIISSNLNNLQDGDLIAVSKE